MVCVTLVRRCDGIDGVLNILTYLSLRLFGKSCAGAVAVVGAFIVESCHMSFLAGARADLQPEGYR